ncbi:hypothetical protein C8J57DRAFT_1250004 [Mycena rebaudengoi]|nr:hypothetical protein C8J57DRAFT_1250004 [Mycena rebaudengoi]
MPPEFNPASVYHQNLPPSKDYLVELLSIPHDSQDLDLFYQCEGWMSHIKEWMPSKLNLVTAPLDAHLHPLLELLMKHVHGYLNAVQTFIQKHQAASVEEFRFLQPKTLQEYAGELVRLLYNSIIQLSDTTSTGYYPLKDVQIACLTSLRNVLKKHTAGFQISKSPLSPTWSRAPWPKPSGSGLPKSGDLSPSSFLFEMEHLMQTEHISTMVQDTPMAYLYNMSTLLQSIHGEEFTDSTSQMTDAQGHKLAFHSELITLHGIQEVYNKLTLDYCKIIQDEIFFEEPILPEFFPEIDIATLFDGPHNKSAGHSFLDDPRNGFRAKFTAWLLANPCFAHIFTYFPGSKSIAWKSTPCSTLLRSFLKLRMVLHLRKIVSGGPSIRETELPLQDFSVRFGGSQSPIGHLM